MPRIAGFSDIELKNFSGLDLRGPPELLADRSLASLINMEVGDLGQLRSRPGFQLRNPGQLFSKPLKFIGHRSTNTSNSILIQTIEDNYATGHGTGFVYETRDGGASWIQISSPAGTQFSCGRGAQYGDANMDIPTLSGKASWNGTTWTLVAPGTNIKASSYDAVYLNDRYWYIEDSTGNVWFSELGNANDLKNGTNTIGFNLDNKDNIVGLCPYRDRMVVFFQNSIRVINAVGPPSSWTVKYIPFGVGVRSQNCWYVVNDLIYFLSSEGFYRTDLTQLEELSKPVQPLFSKRWEAYQESLTGFVKYQDAVGYWRGRFILSMRTYGKSGTSVTPTYKMLMYNLRNGAWSEIVPNIAAVETMPFCPATSFQPVFIGKRSPGSAQYNKEGLYTIFGDANGRVHLFDDEDPVYYDGASNATNFVCSMRTKDIDGDLPYEIKRSPSIGIRYKKTNTTSITSKLTVNEVAQSPVTISGGPTVSKSTKIKGPGYFRKFNIELTDNSDQYFEIEGISINTKKKQGISEVQT